jgi:hypothetical protein
MSYLIKDFKLHLSDWRWNRNLMQVLTGLPVGLTGSGNIRLADGDNFVGICCSQTSATGSVEVSPFGRYFLSQDVFDGDIVIGKPIGVRNGKFYTSAYGDAVGIVIEKVEDEEW